ncbi:uncharacterized protein VP01_2665g1 [Puccinia sorghi]|uniref:Uncharacterized protein n=1 Tax=Puccinia sorghi TaxID=27349 RepID=A0A0L6V423_9BASI|nr:uncharacterized protein VP01_2665g1 [Puccinia sorghi]
MYKVTKVKKESPFQFSSTIWGPLKQKAANMVNELKRLGNLRSVMHERKNIRLMEAVLMPRVSYGAPADKLAVIYTLGKFRSIPLSWHKNRSAVKRTFFVIQASVIGIQEELVNSRPTYWLQPKYLNMNIGKEEAVTSTQHLELSLHPSRGEIVIYTDCLFDKEKGGAGAAIFPDLDLALYLAHGIDAYISNKKSLDTGSFSKAYIFTDNKGVLQCLLDPKAEKTGQYHFLEIPEAWKEICGIIDVTLVWCPGHQGIVGNKAADLLANNASERNGGPETQLRANANILEINTSWTSPMPTLPPLTRNGSASLFFEILRMAFHALSPFFFLFSFYAYPSFCLLMFFFSLIFRLYIFIIKVFCQFGKFEGNDHDQCPGATVFSIQIKASLYSIQKKRHPKRGGLTHDPPYLDARPNGCHRAGPGGLWNQFAVCKCSKMQFFFIDFFGVYFSIKKNWGFETQPTGCSPLVWRGCPSKIPIGIGGCRINPKNESLGGFLWERIETPTKGGVGHGNEYCNILSHWSNLVNIPTPSEFISAFSIFQQFSHKASFLILRRPESPWCLGLQKACPKGFKLSINKFISLLNFLFDKNFSYPICFILLNTLFYQILLNFLPIENFQPQAETNQKQNRLITRNPEFPHC